MRSGEILMGEGDKSGMLARIWVPAVAIMALTIAGGAISVLLVLYMLSHYDDISRDTIYLLCIVVAAIVIVCVVLLVSFVHGMERGVFRPLKELAKATNYVARTGNIHIIEKMDVEFSEYTAREDEIGSVIKSFRVMLEDLIEKVEVLQLVAQGDLRRRARPASEEDHISIAINEVVTNISKVVGDVVSATEQLSSGAHELSNGAQSLSQSASEQSAMMDGLHVTAGEIASEAASNAARAAEALKLASSIRSSASEGGSKMVNMTIAMKEINTASHAIGSVMKVIDEIAFQTNILALNAAVEAARAGAHGKGFAVVADEVRNLANKSGSTANDSNALIADTISKSEMGTRTVDEAIAFFKTIEEGIANTNDLLGEIAKAAKGQSEAIEHINRNVTDMTGIVYHNSATAEQGAAASEQISSQAMMLKGTINHFLLGDDKQVDFIPEAIRGAIPDTAPLYEFASPLKDPAADRPAAGGLSPAGAAAFTDDESKY